eukprot:TRINITY_DN15517_c0_g1_i1.p1 TRINITY_DN15517_c0_g1~~TRINITY_DN15517_c0_g1_i1.p1  ORF type:complete len:504 (-),score=92.18 TRINITY_DN15517_c0_g1_i1:13-1500(-)
MVETSDKNDIFVNTRIETDSLDPEVKFDVVIVGAGIAGSALAYALGGQGRSVCILERDLKEPDRIVGELLQPGGILRLEELGLEKCVENIDSIDVYGYGIISKEVGAQQLTYPLHENRKVIGRSFHHGRFVQQLRRAAKSQKGVTMIEATANKIVEDDKNVVTGVGCTIAGEQVVVRASLVIICDGCMSNFRSKLGGSKPNTGSYFVGSVLHNCKLPFPNHGHVVLGEPSPILMYQIGTNDVRILVDVPAPMPSISNGDMATYLKEKTIPQLPEQCQAPFLEAIAKNDLKSMPNQKLHTDHAVQQRPGIIAIGDTWNMRHPLTGGGMTVALSDVCHLKTCLNGVDFNNHAEIQNALTLFYIKRKGLAVTINILAQALYGVFTTPNGDPIRAELRKACVGYFQLGGQCVSGPMSLLAGICPRPIVLIVHFFLVALYACWKLNTPFPTPQSIARSYKVLGAASWIVLPLMKGEKLYSLFSTVLSYLFAPRKPAGMPA